MTWSHMEKMTIKVETDDIRLYFGIGNHSLIIKRGKEFLCEDIVLEEGVIIIEVDVEG